MVIGYRSSRSNVATRNNALVGIQIYSDFADTLFANVSPV